MSTLEALQDILVNEYRVPRDQVGPDATMTTMGLDSLSFIELMFKIEDHFHLKIEEDIPNNLVTVNDVVGFIDGLLASGATTEEAKARLSA